MKAEKGIDQRYRRLGLLLLALAGLWFAAVAWLYYNPPENAMQIAVSITNWLPHIAGINNLSELNIWGDQFGDRIALVLAISYVPMFIIGTIFLLVELWAGSITKKMRWRDFLVLITLMIVLIGGSHYFLYWTDVFGRRLSILHPLAAVAGPYLAGFSIAALVTSVMRFKIYIK